MFKENDECCAIQCEKCGGTMYSDAASTSFICSFCGNKEPWPNSENILDSEIKYRHKPVEVVNGLVKLGHVYFMEPLPEMLKNNTQSIEDKLGVFSALSTKVYEESHTIKLPCPLCGADVTGESTQTIFTCEYCGHRLTQEELKAGGYNKDQLIGAGSRSYPSIALPFKLTKEQAFGRAQLLMKREPMSFKGAEKAIKEKFTAFYTPYTLADLRVKAQISSNKGDCEIYQEVLNWVYPQTYVFDENAVDMVAPWNFDEFAPFDPVFLEGDVHITTRSNLFPVQKYLDRMINEQLCNRLSENYGLQNVKIEKWARNLRKHSADIMLPVLPKITPAPEASPINLSKSLSSRLVKSMPASFAHSASSLVVMTLSISRNSAIPNFCPAAFISSRRISNFFAVQGVKATLTIFLGSMPIFCAK